MSGPDIIGFNGRITLSSALNNIICGDCLAVMYGMPDKCVDIIVTSPPYNILNSSGNGLKQNSTGKWKNASIKAGYKQHADKMPNNVYVSWQRKCLHEMMRLLKDDGAIFYNNKNRVQNGIMQDRGEITRGFPVRQIITWKRKGGINFNSGYFLPTTEQIYLICRKPFRLAKGANKYTDVWEITQEMKNPHPAPFPEELTDRIIQSTTGQVILDPFGGSGTTAVSAKRYGRDYILIEQSKEYCELAKARISGTDKWRETAY